MGQSEQFPTATQHLERPGNQQNVSLLSVQLQFIYTDGLQKRLLIFMMSFIMHRVVKFMKINVFAVRGDPPASVHH